MSSFTDIEVSLYGASNSGIRRVESVSAVIFTPFEVLEAEFGTELARSMVYACRGIDFLLDPVIASSMIVLISNLYIGTFRCRGSAIFVLGGFFLEGRWTKNYVPIERRTESSNPTIDSKTDLACDAIP